MTATEPTLAQLREAATVIRNATDITRTTDPADLAAAHNTLNEQRHHTTGALREAIDVYLDDETWHQGPFTLLHAVTNLTHQLGLPNPDTAHITEQPQLF